MTSETLLRAAQILRSQASHAMPLAQLHARLKQELGTGVGSYAHMYQQLKQQPGTFMIFDSPRLLLRGSERWPSQVREAYDQALDGAGLGACACVALAERPFEAEDGPIARAGASLSALWRAAENDSALCEFLKAATRQLDEISAILARDAAAAHPTTRLPDPPQ